VSPIAIGWIVFALIFGSALLVMFAHDTLPEHHLSSDSKDVVKLGIALIATMSALVLSPLVASAKSAFVMRSNQLTQASAGGIFPQPVGGGMSANGTLLTGWHRAVQVRFRG
jgi:hypothetical protein